MRCNLRFLRLAGIAALLLAGGLAAAPAVVLHAAPSPTTFTYNGSEQTYVVPAGVTSVTIQANGGHGDNNSCGGYSLADLSSGTSFGGYGASVTDTIPVTPGQTLYVDPGTDGSGPAGGDTGSSSYQTGGNAGTASCFGGGGGGYSTVLTCSLFSSSCFSQFWTGSDPRLIVAGGGGGGGGAGGCDGGNAGSDGVGGGNSFVCGFGGGGGGNGNGSAGENADIPQDDTGGGGATQSGVGLGGSGDNNGENGFDDIGGNGYSPLLCLLTSVKVTGDFGFGSEGICAPKTLCPSPAVAADFRELDGFSDCGYGGGGGGGYYGGGGGSSDFSDGSYGAGGGAGSSWVPSTATKVTFADDTSDTPEVIITPIEGVNLTIISTGMTTGTKTYNFSISLTPAPNNNCTGSFSGTGAVAGSSIPNITITGNYYGNTVYFLANYQNSLTYFFGTLTDRPQSPGNATGTGKNSAGGVTQTYVAVSSLLFQANQLGCQDLALAGPGFKLMATKNVPVTTVIGSLADPDAFSGVNPDLTVTVGFGDGTPNGMCKGSSCFTSSTLPNTIKFFKCEKATAPAIPGGIPFPGTPLDTSCQIQMIHIYKAVGCFSVGVTVLDSDQAPALSLSPGPTIFVGGVVCNI